MAGHLQTVDIYYQNTTYRVINVYAPCEAQERKSWFDTVVLLVIPGSTFVLGDFNTVHASTDRCSGLTDPTTQTFNDFIQTHDLCECHHDKMFTFQSASNCSKQS